ncbi:tRNA (guanosine(18)-2'-O)-methyltransferase Ecym_3359 [Eremothecium cymbalariae DBVPG|uniref:tRNA/rRNA methyltransferase SpoU type domain-containing protein n=1 Tax=Eremothecium cymbalariae (strain CBS 270.75 / DBVPG 7215 / KCTC 17166 / NRRL Y-17582) TaxID=931890 RepID=G8JRS8_ERECY|nr:Hypothetical protein Ecym_3359 [Eremothecium cymbalariae DBVPG\
MDLYDRPDLSIEKQFALISKLISDGDYKTCYQILNTIECTKDILLGIGALVVEGTFNTLEDAGKKDPIHAGLDEFDDLGRLISVLPETAPEISDWLVQHLVKYMFDKPEFSGKITSLFGCSLPESATVLNMDVIFNFISAVTLNQSAEISDDPRKSILGSKDLQKLLILLHACDDESISNRASLSFRWNMGLVVANCSADVLFDEFVWSFVPTMLLDNRKASTYKNALKFWLRYLMNGTFSRHLLNFMKSDGYWHSLQMVLESTIHEHRKIGLSLLKLTLQNLPHDVWFKNKLIAWEATDTKVQLEAWKRFVTFYEIMALDTALNQLEAAAADILELFKDPSIPPSWGVLLFSTGMKSTMESVRRYSLKLMLCVKDRSVFWYNPAALRYTFMVIAMQASNFDVSKDKCTYGEELSQFVKDILVSDSHEYSISDRITLILRVIWLDRPSFDPAKIYVAFGLLKMLIETQFCILNREHISLIQNILKMEAQDTVFNTTLQAIWLEILMFTDISDTDMLPLFTAFEIHVSICGYNLIIPLFNKYKYKFPKYDPIILNNCDSVLVYLMYGVIPSDVNRAFLLKLAKVDIDHSPFSEAYQSCLQDFISGPSIGESSIDFETYDKNFDDLSYEKAYAIVSFDAIPVTTYKVLNLSSLFEFIKTSFDLRKLKLFSSLYRNTVLSGNNLLIVPIEDIYILYDTIKRSLKDGNKHARIKDNAYGAFFNICHSVVRLNSNDMVKLFSMNGIVDQIVKLASKNFFSDNDDYIGNSSIVSLFEYVFDLLEVADPDEETKYYFCTKILKTLEAIWCSVCSYRLILNQRDLHIGIIRTTFHPVALILAYDETEISEILLSCGKNFIEQAFSRRAFLPCLTNRIKRFIQTYNDFIPKERKWLTDILVASFSHQQEYVNIFTIKPVIANLFDRNFTSLQIKNGLYEYVYGPEEVSTKINVISSLLCSSDDFRHTFCVQLLTNDSNIVKPKKKTDGQEEIQRVAKWQLLLLSKLLGTFKLTNNVIKYILPCLVEESSPLVRIYAEWLVALELCENFTDEHPSQIEQILFNLMEDDRRPVVVVSAEKVCYIALRALEKNNNSGRLLRRILTMLIPNCASNKPLIRHFSNSLILCLWPEFNSMISDDTLRSIIKNLYINAQKTAIKGQYRSGDAIIWSINDDCSLTNIFGGIIMKVTDHQVPYISRSQFENYLDNPSNLLVGEDENDKWLLKRVTSTSSNSPNIQQKNSPLQTKSGAWETILDIDKKDTSVSVKRSELIVVASLVDKPPNLGGICRLCDVLGVGLLTVQDIRVKNHPQFKNVAVTADHWMPMEEVQVECIIDFMKQKKSEGYTLIGLEQTDQSVQLDHNYSFPTKSLILLGTEAEGIPGHLLSELDLCLEIKQSGIIRSMNIQTATAVVVHSYSAQHI